MGLSRQSLAVVAVAALGFGGIWRAGLAVQHYHISRAIANDPSAREIEQISAFLELGLSVILLAHAVAAAWLIRHPLRLHGVLVVATAAVTGLLMAGSFLRAPILSTPRFAARSTHSWVRRRRLLFSRSVGFHVSRGPGGQPHGVLCSGPEHRSHLCFGRHGSADRLRLGGCCSWESDSSPAPISKRHLTRVLQPTRTAEVGPLGKCPPLEGINWDKSHRARKNPWTRRGRPKILWSGKDPLRNGRILDKDLIPPPEFLMVP